MELQAKVRKSKQITKFLLWVLLVLVLGIAGFIAGAQTGLIDVPALVAKYDLYRYPIFDRYFSEPVTNFEPVPIDTNRLLNNTLSEAATKDTPSGNQAAQAPITSDAVTQRDTGANLIRESQKKPESQTKQIAKLARLYSSMRAPDAAAILNNLDNSSVLAILSKMEEDQAAKILTLFEAERAADLTRAMLNSQP